MISWFEDLKQLNNLKELDLYTEFKHFKFFVIFNNFVAYFSLLFLFLTPFFSVSYAFPSQKQFLVGICILAFFLPILVAYIITSLRTEVDRNERFIGPIDYGELHYYLIGFKGYEYLPKSFENLIVFPINLLLVLFLALLILVNKNEAVFLLFSFSFMLLVVNRTAQIVFNKSSLIVLSILFLIMLLIPYLFRSSLVGIEYEESVISYSFIVVLILLNFVQKYLKNDCDLNQAGSNI